MSEYVLRSVLSGRREIARPLRAPSKFFLAPYKQVEEEEGAPGLFVYDWPTRVFLGD
jgi:hypothetical protein